MFKHSDHSMITVQPANICISVTWELVSNCYSHMQLYFIVLILYINFDRDVCAVYILMCSRMCML